MLDQVNETTGAYPVKATADAGYWASENVQACETRGVDGYISVRRKLVEGDEDLPESKKAMDGRSTRRCTGDARRSWSRSTAKSNAARDSQRFKCMA